MLQTRDMFHIVSAMKSFQDILSAWPTKVALACEVGVPERRVRGWWAQDSIPGAYWLSVERAAAKRAEIEEGSAERARWGQITVALMARIAAGETSPGAGSGHGANAPLTSDQTPSAA